MLHLRLFALAALFACVAHADDFTFNPTPLRGASAAAKLFDPAVFKGQGPKATSAPTAKAGIGHGFSTVKQLLNISFGAGLGFQLDPGGFAFHTSADIHLLRYLAVGPYLQYALDGEGSKLYISAHAKGIIDWGGLQPCKPYVHAGIGLAQRFETDPKCGCRKADYGLLVVFGTGTDYYLTPLISIGGEVLFNWTPKEVLYDKFTVSFQVATLRIHF